MTLAFRFPCQFAIVAFLFLLTCVVAIDIVGAQVLGDQEKPKSVSYTILECLVDNSSWLFTLADDPITFFADLCPSTVNKDESADGIRGTIPDIAPDRSISNDANTVPISITKQGLTCLVLKFSSIPQSEVELSWLNGAIETLSTETVTLNLNRCEVAGSN